MLSTAKCPCPAPSALGDLCCLPSPSHGSHCTNDVVDPSDVQHVGDGGHSTALCRDLQETRADVSLSHPLERDGRGNVSTEHMDMAVHSVPVCSQALKDLLALKYICLILAKSVV